MTVMTQDSLDKVRDFIMTNLIDEESYEVLALIKRAEAGELLGKKVVVYRKISRSGRFALDELIISYLQAYGVVIEDRRKENLNDHIT